MWVSLSLSHTHTHTLSFSLSHTHSLSLSLSLSISISLSLSLSACVCVWPDNFKKHNAKWELLSGTQLHETTYLHGQFDSSICHALCSINPTKESWHMPSAHIRMQVNTHGSIFICKHCSCQYNFDCYCLNLLTFVFLIFIFSGISYCVKISLFRI